MEGLHSEGRIHVPAGEGRGTRVNATQRFKVIDVDGRQCADLFAFRADDVSEYHSAEHTRVHIDRLFPRPGEHFVTNHRRPILYFEEDSTPGRHDMLVAACDPSRYAQLGVEGWHASCEENLRQAMEQLGHSEIEIPQPINLFTNIAVAADGSLEWQPAVTASGDFVTLRAEVDVIVVVSACPQDIVAINAGQPSAIALEAV
jgi:uncharacterized protein